MRFRAARIIPRLQVTTGFPKLASMAGAASAARMSGVEPELPGRRRRLHDVDGGTPMRFRPATASAPAGSAMEAAVSVPTWR